MTENVFDKPHATSLSLSIEDLLKAAAVGDIVTWEQLEAACDTPREGLYDAVRKAKKRLAKTGYAFVTREGIGQERIDENGVVTEVLPRMTRNMHRLGRRIVRTAESVDVLKVDVNNRAALVGAAALGALAVASSKPKAIQALGEQRLTTSVLKESLSKLSAG